MTSIAFLCLTADCFLLQASHSSQKTDKKSGSSHKKKSLTGGQSRSPSKDIGAIDNTGIKFPDNKTAGVALRSADLNSLSRTLVCKLLVFYRRSHRMKLPQSVGQKKSKAVEQMLGTIGLEVSPMPTEEIVKDFNVLRSDMASLYAKHLLK